jgi:hypothetical protein
VRVTRTLVNRYLADRRLKRVGEVLTSRLPDRPQYCHRLTATAGIGPKKIAGWTSTDLSSRIAVLAIAAIIRRGRRADPLLRIVRSVAQSACGTHERTTPMSPDNFIQKPGEPDLDKHGVPVYEPPPYSLLLLCAACFIMQVVALVVYYRYGHHNLQIWLRILVFAAALPGIALVAARKRDLEVHSRAHASLLITAYVILSLASVWLLILGLSSFGDVARAIRYILNHLQGS